MHIGECKRRGKERGKLKIIRDLLKTLTNECNSITQLQLNGLRGLQHQINNVLLHELSVLFMYL